MQGRGHVEGWAEQLGCAKSVEIGTLHALPGGTESGLRREMMPEESIRMYLVTKVGTSQGEGAESAKAQPGQRIQHFSNSACSRAGCRERDRGRPFL